MDIEERNFLRGTNTKSRGWGLSRKALPITESACSEPVSTSLSTNYHERLIVMQAAAANLSFSESLDFAGTSFSPPS